MRQNEATMRDIRKAGILRSFVNQIVTVQIMSSFHFRPISPGAGSLEEPPESPFFLDKDGEPITIETIILI
jgi:hypothetical protein